MHRNERKTLVFSVVLILIALMAIATSRAQTPVPSPSPEANTGDYIITSSFEMGVRGLDVNGDHEKYRSDHNYRAGVRLFDSSLLIEDKSSSPYRPFDSLLLQGSGWGSDPSGMFRMNMDRTGFYKFDSNVRRVRYFNNLKNFATSFSQPVSLGSLHRSNTQHDFGDFDLTIFPERAFRMRLGYSFNKTEGPGTNTVRPLGDEFQVESFVKARSQDFRVGVEGSVLGFNLGLNYGHREFRDRTKFFSNAFNPGNNLTNLNTLSFFNRQFQVKGTTNYGLFFVQRTFAEHLDFTGRILHAFSKSKIFETDFLTGTGSSGTPPVAFNVFSDEISYPGLARRPQTRADLGLTLRVTRGFRVSNTFTFDQFVVDGNNTYTEFLQSTTLAGGPRPAVFSNERSWRYTGYRRLSNLIEADVQVNNRFGFNLGYRFSDRKAHVGVSDFRFTTNAILRDTREEVENKTHAFIAGTKFKPMTNWAVYVDLERGESDSVFTRLANNDFFNFRIRSIANIKQFTLNLSAITKDSDSPGSSLPITGGNPPVVVFPSLETIANSKIRIYSGSVDWTPRNDFSFSTGYTYHHQTGFADIIVPIGTPIFTSTRFLLGASTFKIRDSYFFFDVSAKPINRVSLFASYRINNDDGQGGRLETVPQDMFTSYQMRSHFPEIKMAIRLTRNLDWNLGYQYYSYRETPFANLFATPASIFPAQNYTAHMPYTSLRFYFGGAQDR